MGFFKNLARKTVETVKAEAEDVMAEATEDKVALWSGVAKIGIFALMAIGAARGAKHERRDKPDASNITINNYYYRDPKRRY